MKGRTDEGGQRIQMKIAFRHVKEEGVIGGEEVERWQEAEGEGLLEVDREGTRIRVKRTIA